MALAQASATPRYSGTGLLSDPAVVDFGRVPRGCFLSYAAKLGAIHGKKPAAGVVLDQQGGRRP